MAAVQCARSERYAEDVFWRSDGSALHVALSMAPLYDYGEHVGAIVVFRDVGERHRAAELLHTRRLSSRRSPRSGKSRSVVGTR